MNFRLKCCWFRHVRFVMVLFLCTRCALNAQFTFRMLVVQDPCKTKQKSLVLLLRVGIIAKNRFSVFVAISSRR